MEMGILDPSLALRLYAEVYRGGGWMVIAMIGGIFSFRNAHKPRAVIACVMFIVLLALLMIWGSV